MNITLNAMFIFLQSWLFLLINIILNMTFLFEKLQFYWGTFPQSSFFFWKVQLYSNDFFSDNYLVLTITTFPLKIKLTSNIMNLFFY